MASELETLWDGGVVANYQQGEDASDTGRSTRSRASSKQRAAPKSAPGGGRAKRGQGQVLSSSFTCWRNAPDT